MSFVGYTKGVKDGLGEGELLLKLISAEFIKCLQNNKLK
jgi:hypothetical protein